MILLRQKNTSSAIFEDSKWPNYGQLPASRSKLRIQKLPVLAGHRRVTVCHRDFDALFIGFDGLFAVSGSKVSAGEHAVRVSLIVGLCEVVLENVDYLLILTLLLVLLCKAKHHHRVVRVSGEHLLEDLDSILHISKDRRYDEPNATLKGCPTRSANTTKKSRSARRTTSTSLAV